MKNQSEKKKILIRIGSMRHGGAEKAVYSLLKNLPENKYDIDLLLNLNSGKYLEMIPNWVNLKYLHSGEMIITNRPQDIFPKAKRVLKEKLYKTFPKLLYKNILGNKKYDIEFAGIHGFRDEILNSPVKSSKKIVWIHNDLRKTQFHNYTDSEIKKFFGFDKILVISDEIQQDFKDMAESDHQRQKIERIYNPIDTQEIIQKSLLKPEGYNFNSAIPTFLSVGTVFPQKGFDRLIRVHKKLLGEGLMHKILIIGDGYDFENMQNLIREFRVEHTATLLGFTDNPYPFFKNSDFYILSSRYEGFPTVLFEAITLKKKIIATSVSGVKEMLQNGKFGLIVENSEDGIYNGMKQALTSPRIFDTFAATLANFEMPFNLKNSVKKFEQIFDSL